MKKVITIILFFLLTAGMIAQAQNIVTYNAVKDASCLTDGAKVFFGTSQEGENYIMGIYDVNISKNNIKGVPATYGEKRHTVTAEAAYAYTVQREGDYIIFVDADGNYLRPIVIANCEAALHSITKLNGPSVPSTKMTPP